MEGDDIALISQTDITSAGTADNVHNYKITNNDGLDMTIHYNINLVPGTLEIYKKQISFKSNDFEFTYDGDDHKFALKEVIYDSSDVVVGQSVELSYPDDSKMLLAGSYSNEFVVKIVNGDTDVTPNYDITYDFGTTLINKRPISILSDSVVKTYDDDELTANSYTIKSGSIAKTDKIVSTGPSYTEAGLYDNDLTIAFVNKDTNEDVTDSYDLEYQSGSIEIKKRPISIDIKREHVTYDGKPHKNTYVLSSGTLAKKDYLKEKVNEERYDAGNYVNDTFEIDVYDKDNLVNTQNYDITYNGRENAMTIDRRPITIKLLDKEKVYDGTSIRSTIPEDEDLYAITSGSLADNEYIEFSYTNDLTNAGTETIQYNLKIYHLAGKTKNLSKDKDVTSNYKITDVDGSFTVNKRPIKIWTKDATHIYDRETEIDNFKDGEGNKVEYYYIEGTLAPNQKILNCGISCTEVDVGVHNYTIDANAFKICDEEDEDKDYTSNYNVSFENNGHLTIEQREITVTMKENHRIYDGTPFSSSEYEVDNIIEGDYLTFSGLPKVTHVSEGHVQNNPTSEKVFIGDDDENPLNDAEVTTNYKVTYENNEDIYIDPRPIKICSPDVTKIFDGTPIVANTTVTVYEDTHEKKEYFDLADGDYYIVDDLDSRDNLVSFVHVYDSNINNVSVSFFNANHDPVSSDYAVDYDYGTITINPCKIGLSVYQQHIIYDGSSHDVNYAVNDVTSSTGDIFIVSGAMPENYTLNAEFTVDNMVNAGTYPGLYECHVTTTSPYGVEAGDFEFSYSGGTQIVLQRQITITTLGGNKVYDGAAFDEGLNIDDKYWVSSGSFAVGQDIAEITLYYTKGGETVDEIVEPGTYTLCAANIIIRDPSGNNVTGNYNININKGVIEIYEPYA